MKTLTMILLFAISSAAFAVPGDLYVYPAGGQDDATLERDRYECYVWATAEAGFDPARDKAVEPAKLVRVPVGDNPNEGATTKGTLVGTIAGVAIGDSHEGAALGAVLGTLTGAVIENEGEKRARREARAEAEAILAENEALAAGHADYRRAFTACLEGRGYVVR